LGEFRGRHSSVASFVSHVYRLEALSAAAKIEATGNVDLVKRALTVATKISAFLWIPNMATISGIPK
jgi:hypothetical protein